MFLRKAMRYYRLWIYTCNAVLFVAVIVLLALATHTVSHTYFKLIPTPPAYDPTLIYAYIALILQAGLLQAIGCMGAIKLSQKLLHIYWSLMVVLLVGDFVVGLVWFHRFPKLTVKIASTMNETLGDYGSDSGTTYVWDVLQKTEKCCGVISPEDYSYTKWGSQSKGVPKSCCSPRGSKPVQADQAARHVPHYYTELYQDRYPFRFKNYTCHRQDYRLHKKGCELPLRSWVTSSAESLFILGFCVISFIKLCFVGILKFEIKEMIEKIKVLQGESLNAPNAEIAAALGLVLPGPNQAETELLGTDEEEETVEETESRRYSEDQTEEAPKREENKEVESSVLLREGRSEGYDDDDADSSFSNVQPIKKIPTVSHILQDCGTDSDTNSHTALISDTPIHNQTPLAQKKHNGNNNDLQDIQPVNTFFHVRQTQI